MLKYRESWRRFAEGPLAKYLAATAIFAASRGLVALGVYLGTYFRPAPVEGAWSLGSKWLDPFLRFDAGWYLSILRDGYQAVPAGNGPSNLAFFPLYPMLASVVSRLGCGDAAALLAVSNGAALVSLLLLVRLGTEKFGERSALYVVAVFCFFPTSFFLDAGYSESTCIAFVLASLLALEDRRFLAGALLAGAATAARSPGVAIAPVVAYAVYADGRNALRSALYGALACGGLLLFIAYQAWAFGDPLGFVAAQRAWGKGTLLAQILRGEALAALFPLRPALAWFVLPLLLMALNRRYLGRGIWLYGVAVLLIPYLTVGVTPSMPRFVLLCVPLWFCIARILRPRPLLAAVYFSFSAALLVTNTAKFSQWYFVA